MNISRKLKSANKEEVGVSAKRKQLLSNIKPYLWITPSLLLIALIIFLPVLELFLTSFSKISLAGIRKGFIGLTNYMELFSDATFIMVLKNTLIWTVAVVGISTVLSLGIAIIFNTDFPGRRLVRAWWPEAFPPVLQKLRNGYPHKNNQGIYLLPGGS